MSAPTLSGMTPDIRFVWRMYKEICACQKGREDLLLNIIRTSQPFGGDFDQFFGMSEQEVHEFFAKIQSELDALIILDLLSAAEGLLRNDFEKRVQDTGDTSRLADDFRLIARHCVRGDRRKNPHNLLSLVGIWSSHFPGSNVYIPLFLEYWPFRNWLAHGRWFDSPYGGKPLPPPDDVKDCVDGLLNDIGISLL